MCNNKFSVALSVAFLFVVFQFSLNAQDIDLIKGDHDNYIWGEGVGSSVKAADQAALAEIIGQISTQVENTSIHTTSELNSEIKKTWSDVVKTYSNATLTNTRKIVINKEPDAKVFRYIKRSEVAKIFESRKNKIIELAKYGELALKNLQIADALRNFYWSQTLLRTHPDASNIKMTGMMGNELLLITWLPMQITDIFANIHVRVDQIETKDNYTNYILDIRYNGQSVRNFDYCYWVGQDWSSIVSAKDGLGVVELPQSKTTASIRLKCEYAFDNEAVIDMELRDVMQKLPEVPYKSCYINLEAKVTEKTIPNPPSIKTEIVEQKPASSLGLVAALTNITDKEAIMKKVIWAISTKNYLKAQSYFTLTGFSIFQSLLEYGNARIIKAVELKYYQFGDMVICRSIPMSFSFKTNNRTFVEDVVFYFDKSNRIDYLTFGLSKTTTDDIASNKDWSEGVRMQLINFLENYKTAYALKRLDYIEKIFSDDALIITGRLTQVVNTHDIRYLNNKIVKYNKLSKIQYLKNLRYSFGANEYINLRFADNIVKQSGKTNEVYGIQIKQDYFSTHYGDSGYLFLLIDFTDSIAPQIHVRTWQPEKNADGSIYGLPHF